jgi:hypothetical protein
MSLILEMYLPFDIKGLSLFPTFQTPVTKKNLSFYSENS